MNKKEISEIRRLFTNEKCGITRICGCYVDGDKRQVLRFKDAFLSLPEEEIFKYYDIFKKSMSGTIGKNLINMEFPLEQETVGGTQEFLLRLRDSRLKDDSLIDEFYDKIISTYHYPENYYIILVHAAYDIPKKTTDGIEMEDASDYVYEYIMCSICPVNLSKAGLCYNAETNNIEDRIRDWIVDKPDVAFLFPAFNDRNTDIHGLLYYSKDPELSHIELTNDVLGVQIPLPAKQQMTSFHAVIEDTLGTACDYEVVRAIHENLNDMIAEQKENPDPLELSKTDVKKLLSSSGVSDKQLETFEARYEKVVDDAQPLMATNIATPRKFEIKSPDVKITVNPERSDLVEQRIIDGKAYLVIEMTDDVEVNGVHINHHPTKKQDS